MLTALQFSTPSLYSTMLSIRGLLHLKTHCHPVYFSRTLQSLQSHLQNSNSQFLSRDFSSRPRSLASDSLIEDGDDPVPEPKSRKGSSSATESDSESNSANWAVYDPVAGRLVLRTDLDPSQGATPEAKPKPKASKKIELPPPPPPQAQWSSVARRKTAKAKLYWVCANCGESYSQWWGICRHCEATGSLTRFTEAAAQEVNPTRGAEVSDAAVRSWLPQKLDESVPKSLVEVNEGRKEAEWRIPL